MEMTEKTYCRLCAEQKPVNKMLSLTLEPIKEWLSALKQLKLKFIDIDDPYLPQNVCFVCSHAVESVLNTIKAIETAQSVLKTIFVNPLIKPENGQFFDEDSRTAADDEGYSQLDPQKVDFLLTKDENDSLETLDKPKAHKIKKIKSRKHETFRIKKENGLLDNSMIQESKRLHIESIQDNGKVQSIHKVIKTKMDIDDDIPLSKIKSSWSNFAWICRSCHLHFKTSEDLINHTTNTHNICALFKCMFCEKKAVTLKTFIKHSLTHLPCLKYSCYQCFEMFESVKACNLHKKSHKTSLFHCPCCNMGFELNSDLIDHQNKYVNEDITFKKRNKIPFVELICNICSKKFPNRSALKTHKQTHLIDRKREYVCEKCGNGYYSINSLKEHSISHQDERPYQCQICKLTFKSHLHLRRHVSVHESVKPFSCEKCGKCFRLQKSLQSHSIIHTDQLPYECTFCNKRFKFKTILNQHIRQHTGVKPYRCDACDRDFTNWPNYNKHMKRKHGMNMSKRKTISEKEEQNLLSKSTEEWKQIVMANRKRGRPKANTTLTTQSSEAIEFPSTKEALEYPSSTKVPA